MAGSWHQSSVEELFRAELALIVVAAVGVFLVIEARKLVGRLS